MGLRGIDLNDDEFKEYFSRWEFPDKIFPLSGVIFFARMPNPNANFLWKHEYKWTDNVNSTEKISASIYLWDASISVYAVVKNATKAMTMINLEIFFSAIKYTKSKTFAAWCVLYAATWLLYATSTNLEQNKFGPFSKQSLFRIQHNNNIFS